MGIEKRQPGAAKAAAAAGTVIGTAAREKEDRARVEREQARDQTKAMQKQARQDEIKFALHKRQVDWERSLQKEQRQEDYKLLAEDRAAEGAIERIEFSKNMEYQYSEQKRMEKRDRAQAKYDQVKKHVDEGLVDPPEKSWETRSMLHDLDREINELSPRALPKEVKPRSAASQVSEIDATLELESYTQQDLIEAGLDPADFPGIATNEDAVELAAREQVTQVEERGGQVYLNKQTGERIVSYDGGDTWESLGATQEEVPVEIIDDREGFLKRLLLSKPLEGRLPKSTPANFGAFDRNR